MGKETVHLSWYVALCKSSQLWAVKDNMGHDREAVFTRKNNCGEDLIILRKALMHNHPLVAKQDEALKLLSGQSSPTDSFESYVKRAREVIEHCLQQTVMAGAT